MQVAECSAFGLRAAVLRMRHRELPLRFTVYPMIHLGEQRFYDDVRDRLRDHQLIVAEGIRGWDARVHLLVRTYRLAGRNRQLGLVVQPNAGMLDVGVPLVRPDMTGAAFRAGWGALPWSERLMVWLLAPPYALYLRFFGSRAFLARIAAYDDDIEIDQASDTMLRELISDDRDALLFDALATIQAERGSQPIDVAIVYGAGHVPAIVRYLTRLGYVLRGAEWLTVFRL